MTTGATGQLGLALPVQGELSGTWGDTVNNGITQYTNIAIAGTLTLTNDGAVTLANTTGDAAASNITSTLTGAGTVTAQFAIVKVTGTLTATKVITAPSYSKTYVVDNTTATYGVTFKASGQTGVTIVAGEKCTVYFNGTDYVKVATSVVDGVSTISFGTTGLTPSTATAGAVTVAGTLITTNGGTGLASFTAGDLPYYASGTALSKLAIGTNGYILQSNGTAPTWVAASSVVGGAAGSNTQIQFNNSGSLGASSLFTWDGAQIQINGITVGRGAGAVSTNTAVGASALAANTSGVLNDSFGYWSLKANTTGNTNTAFGSYSLTTNTTGSLNTAFGSEALYANTAGGYNTALGQFSLHSNTTASNNTAVGYRALYANTTGYSNVALGSAALNSVTTGVANVAVGTDALFANTGDSNTALGHYAMRGNTTGGYSVAVGQQALYSNTTASNNTALGYQALYSNTTNLYNTAVGYQALYSNTNELNTAVGYQAGYSNTTGPASIFIGKDAGRNATTGGSNTFLGHGAGFAGTALTTGYNNIYVGTNAAAAAAAETYAIVIGQNSTSKGNSTGYINPQGGGVYQGNNSTTWSTTSDQRLKKNIVDNNLGLEKIAGIRVRNFEYRVEDEITELPTNCAIKREGVQLGVIAQELQAVLPECVKQESTGVLSVDTDNLTWYLINAVKQLSAEVENLKSQLKGA